MTERSESVLHAETRFPQSIDRSQFIGAGETRGIDMTSRAADTTFVTHERIPGGFDKSPGGKHDGRPMADNPTRQELDAKLETIEARMELRAQRIESSVNAMIEKIDLLATESRETRRESRSHRTQIVLAVLAAAVAIWLTNIQLIPAMTQATIAAMEYGRTSGDAKATASGKGELTTPAPAK